MSRTNLRQILLGALLLVVGSAVVLGVGSGLTASFPKIVASLAALGLAAGALLVGTADPGRPV